MYVITEYLMKHATKDRPICSKALASAFNMGDAGVRHLVNSARKSGDPICSNCKGYYVAQDKAELISTIESIRKRIQNMNEAVEGLEKCLTLMVKEGRNDVP